MIRLLIKIKLYYFYIFYVFYIFFVLIVYKDCLNELFGLLGKTLFISTSEEIIFIVSILT